MGPIDLHTHTSFSDGEFPPGELVCMAAEAGLGALAITDHDTMDGLDEALEAGNETGLEVVPGCELSASFQGRTMHVLGLWVRHREADALRAALAGILGGREARNQYMVEKLRSLGMDIDYQELLESAQGTVGRPHMARIMVERGAVKSYEAAFRKYLGRQGLAYAPKPSLPLELAVSSLHEAQATVALAHPYLLGLNGRPLEELVRACKDMGVDALEAYYTDHSQTRTREYIELARRLDMGVCGGSDFHGRAKPGVKLGAGRGTLRVPYEVLEELKARREAKGLWT